MGFLLLFSLFNAVLLLIVGANLSFIFAKFIGNKWILILIIIFSQTYWIARFTGFLARVPSAVTYIAALFFGIFCIAVSTFLIFDILLLITRIVPPFLRFYYFIKANLTTVGLIVLAIIFLQSAVGVFLANHTMVNRYAFKNPLIANGERVRIVHISDLHVSPFTSRARQLKVVDKINALEPDIITISGDILDAGLAPYIDKDLSGVYRSLKSKYGVYVVFGNHEYYSGDIPKILLAFEQSGFDLLRDTLVKIDEINLTVAGRDDYSSKRVSGHERKPLSDVLADNDKGYPVVLLNHQPRKESVREAVENKVFLELTGHTHNAQIFPANLIEKLIYPASWGLWQENDYSLLISCGVGTWGPPMRTNSYSEIVVIDIN
jgi:predicted MPP superfamily phosphohydrolase